MMPNWIRFAPGEPLPPERRYVMIQIDEERATGSAPAVGVGYLRFAAGDLRSPQFIVPGARRGFRVTHWADCLGDDWSAPLWVGKQEKGIDRHVSVPEVEA
jgi:hypothetical protein